jgi:hypothetical protein
MVLQEKRFKWSGDPVSGDLITTCLGCGEQFDGKHSEIKSWENWHLMNCDKQPKPETTTTG